VPSVIARRKARDPGKDRNAPEPAWRPGSTNPRFCHNVSFIGRRERGSTLLTRPHSTGTLTWKSSGETTIVSLGASSPGQGACSAGSVEYDLAGTVVGGTSAYAAVGDTIAAQACVKPNGEVSLVKGTTFGL